jgi:hypothetical protein
MKNLKLLLWLYIASPLHASYTNDTDDNVQFYPMSYFNNQYAMTSNKIPSYYSSDEIGREQLHTIRTKRPHKALPTENDFQEILALLDSDDSSLDENNNIVTPSSTTSSVSSSTSYDSIESSLPSQESPRQKKQRILQETGDMQAANKAYHQLYKKTYKVNSNNKDTTHATKSLPRPTETPLQLRSRILQETGDPITAQKMYDSALAKEYRNSPQGKASIAAYRKTPAYQQSQEKYKAKRKQQQVIKKLNLQNSSTNTNTNGIQNYNGLYGTRFDDILFTDSQILNGNN